MKCTRLLGVATVLLLVSAAPTEAQVFTLDDGLFTGPGAGNSAEDPFGFGLPATGAGLLGPSPSLAFGYSPGDILGPFVGAGVLPNVLPPNGFFINALSNDKEFMGPDQVPFIFLEFTVDRATTGLPGTPLAAEAGFAQQAGDVYVSTAAFAHPGGFVGTLTPGVVPAVPTFGGILATAGGGGSHLLAADESVFGLTATGVPGVLTPSGVATPATIPGNKDNMNAWNNSLFDTTGDMVNDTDFYFSVSPAEAFSIGVSSADMFDVATGAIGSPGVPYAPGVAAGLDFFGFSSDDIDALILFDNGVPLGPGFGGPGGEPLIDYALFSLAPGSATITALTSAGVFVDPSTIFFTDFTGSFGIFALGTDLGIDPASLPGGAQFANIDGMDFVGVPTPGAVALLALAGFCGSRRRRSA